jgi:hypothetical protein
MVDIFALPKLMSTVLPPISTIGLTSEDVTRLSETTHDEMLKVLQEISAPGPSGIKSHSGPQKSESTATSAPAPTAELRQRPAEQSRGPEELQQAPALTKRRGSDSTEDEMDDDAVLIEKPKAE